MSDIGCDVNLYLIADNDLCDSAYYAFPASEKKKVDDS